MSLHARITIGPSRRIRVLERVVTLGAFGLVVATGAARWGSAWPVAFGLVALCGWIVLTSLDRRSHEAAASFVIGDRAAIDIHPGDDGPVEHRELAEGTLHWPGLSVLRLVAAPFSSGRPRHVVAFDRELAVEDAWHLRRYLLWVSRGGVRPDPSVDRSS